MSPTVFKIHHEEHTLLRHKVESMLRKTIKMMVILCIVYFTTQLRVVTLGLVNPMYIGLPKSANIIDQAVAQGVPFAREYGGLLDNRSFGGALVSRTFC